MDLTRDGARNGARNGARDGDRDGAGQGKQHFTYNFKMYVLDSYSTTNSGRLGLHSSQARARLRARSSQDFGLKLSILPISSMNDVTINYIK